MKVLKIYGNTLGFSGLFDTVSWIYNDGYKFGLRQGDAICHHNDEVKEFSMFSNTKIGISYIDEVVKKTRTRTSFL